MSSPSPAVVTHETYKGRLKTYLIGFSLSLILTLLSYSAVINHGLRASSLVAFIIGLAITQFIVQLFFFMHLGQETKPRWKLLVLFFMLGVVLILVVGSLWIMANLNYRMTPQQMNQYMTNQDGGL